MSENLESTPPEQLQQNLRATSSEIGRMSLPNIIGVPPVLRLPQQFELLKGPMVVHECPAAMIQPWMNPDLKGVDSLLISINQRGTFRSPYLSAVARVELLRGQVTIQTNNEPSFLLTSENRVRDVNMTGVLSLTVFGFTQIIVIGADDSLLKYETAPYGDSRDEAATQTTD